MIPGKIFTGFAEFQGIVSVNDFRFLRQLQELHQALLGLLGSFCFALGMTVPARLLQEDLVIGLQADTAIWVLRKVRVETILTRTQFPLLLATLLVIHEKNWQCLDPQAQGSLVTLLDHFHRPNSL